MEDLEGNPMVDAFRQLREEDKTRVELVLMYKDEGNEFMRKKTVKERHEAIKRYSHALTLLDAADEARKEGNEDEADKSVNLFHLRSQTFNNRAMALMFLKNYGLALKDLTKVSLIPSPVTDLIIPQALLYDPENVKAHYRKSKVLFQLKRPEFALKACDAGLASLARVMSSSSSPSDKDKDSERELLVLKEQVPTPSLPSSTSLTPHGSLRLTVYQRD
jgi:tetratricopeptide (TPR) repeat protein